MHPIRGLAVVAGLAVLAGCTPPTPPEGGSYGLVTSRRLVAVQAPAAPGVTAAVSRTVEWTVKRDDGGTMTVWQAEPPFRLGQRVKVLTVEGIPRMVYP